MSIRKIWVHAPRPADALTDVQGQAFGRQPRRQADFQEGGVPAPSLLFQGGMGARAERRSTAQEPQKKAAFHRSLPGWTTP